MSDYDTIEQTIKQGIDPVIVCQTCSWTTLCVKPPTMTKEDVEAKMKKAEAEDRAKFEQAKAEGRPAGMPMGQLVTALAFSGKEAQSLTCPIFRMRLRESPELSTRLKELMQGWPNEPEA